MSQGMGTCRQQTSRDQRIFSPPCARRRSSALHACNLFQMTSPLWSSTRHLLMLLPQPCRFPVRPHKQAYCPPCASTAHQAAGQGSGDALLQRIARHLDEGEDRRAQRAGAEAGPQRPAHAAQRAALQRIRVARGRKVPGRAAPQPSPGHVLASHMVHAGNVDDRSKYPLRLTAVRSSCNKSVSGSGC